MPYLFFFPRADCAQRRDSVTFSGYILRPWVLKNWQLLNISSPQKQLIGVLCILIVSICGSERKDTVLSTQIVAIWRFFMKDICVDIVHMFFKFHCAYCCLFKTYHACSIYLYETRFFLFSLMSSDFELLKAEVSGLCSFHSKFPSLHGTANRSGPIKFSWFRHQWWRNNGRKANNRTIVCNFFLHMTLLPCIVFHRMWDFEEVNRGERRQKNKARSVSP